MNVNHEPWMNFEATYTWSLSSLALQPAYVVISNKNYKRVKPNFEI